jgi:membrane protein required for colicin V production
MTPLDIVVLVLVGGAAVLGGLRGFVTEVLSLFAWVAAIAALKLLHTPATAALTHVVGSYGGAAVLAFLLLFGVVFFIGKLIAGSVGRRTRQSVLGSVDRLLGFGFGALKGLLIATTIFLGANLMYDMVFGGKSERPTWMKSSHTFPLLNASGRAIVDFVNMRRTTIPTPRDTVIDNSQRNGAI